MTFPVHPAGKAVWFIENNLARTLSLDEVARAAGVSRFHMARVFDARMGLTVMAYVRVRRLSLAARQLADGAPDILSLALEAGYASHEAFTRAFRDQFGMTPETVRDRRSLDIIALQEPILMDLQLIDTPSPHRLEKGRAMTLGGLSRHYNASQTAEIPALWQAFAAWLPDVPGRTGEPDTAYGVCYNQDEAGINYMCGVEVAPVADMPEEFRTVKLSAQTYAVFPHIGHITGIRSTWATIWDKWLPESGLEVLPEPFFEKYGPEFDARTGEGGLTLWIAVKA